MKKINDEYIRGLVKEALNEMTPQYLLQARDAAYSQGRYQQANKFEDWANVSAARDFPQRDDFRVSAKSVSWLVNANVKGVPTCSCVLTKNGGYSCSEYSMGQHYNSCSGKISPEFPKFDDRMKTTDKTLARLIAKWWQTYGDVEQFPQLANWHTWCIQ